jgi:alpha-glutamyl/putrescinyl thymine pyrophosphorylase clade 1
MSTTVTIDKLESTEVFPTYFRFASKRQSIYEKRLRGEPPPWTDDPILSQYKFTNVFRASDRTSQFLIRDVIYESGASLEDRESIFRTLYFKLFNSIDNWNAITAEIGVPSWPTFSPKRYTDILDQAKKKGVKIWNAAYMQKPQYREDLPTKHERYLALLKYMMDDRVEQKLMAAKSYREAYHVLRGYPLFGDFLAMQILTDINYGPALNFDENDFIVAGPGALDGMQKCFGIRPDQELAAEIIRRIVEGQEGMFADLGLQPVTLFGRRLTAIDAQNLFCECDKFSRLAHPEYNLKRTEIKQKFRPTGPLPESYFPPKWGLQPP